MTDNVNHPPHYTQGKAACTCGRKIECIDVVRHLPFNVGNAIKYLWRYQLKNGVEDLQKAVWYLNDEIKRLEPCKHTVLNVDMICTECGYWAGIPCIL